MVSRKVFVVNPDVEGQDQAALNVMFELGLSQRDIDVLYTAFWDMDADESGVLHTNSRLVLFTINNLCMWLPSGTVQPVELFAYFEVESTTYEQAVFTLFDEGTLRFVNYSYYRR